MTEPNLWRRAILEAPSVEGSQCVICGNRMENRHHVVPKGIGGRKSNDGPTIPVCGMGNASGCHGLIHSGRVHIRYLDGRYEYARFPGGTSLSQAMSDTTAEWLPFIESDPYMEVC